MVRTFYVQKGKEEIMHKFKETNEKLGLNYSATLVELMEKFNKSNAKKTKDGDRD
jgi:hypothetical protein